MLTVGALVFAAPWVLAALVLLPVIYWLLRATPPAPRLLRFPAIRLLADLVAREETPHRTPWWLLALRLALAALVILALARPLLNPEAQLPGSGPVVLVVDNGWAAGRDWPARQRALADAVDRAERAGRDIVLLPTAPTAPGEPVAASGLLRPAEARGAIDMLAPSPWPSDRAAALTAAQALELPGSAQVIWLSDGLTTPEGRDAAIALAERLQQFGGLAVVEPGSGNAARLLRMPEAEGDRLTVPVERADGDPEQAIVVRAAAADGRPLGREEVRFAPGQTSAEARFELPAEVRNQIVRIAIEDETTAGASLLIDERWRRRPVGIVVAGTQAEAQPLLSDTYYLGRALEPFAEIRHGTIGTLLDPGPGGQGGLAMMLLPDSGMLSGADREALDGWIERGGVLVRFAGPLLAANPDPLVPVALRFGDRILSGALSWTEPMPLAAFDATSPFARLAVPDDVKIQRQVLAEPSPDLPQRTWARLTDGTPIVTAEKRGQGWLVLVHTTAGPEWSNLPLSGLFVEMLRKLTALGAGVAGDAGLPSLAPIETLDGYGRLGTPPPSAVPIAGAAFADTVVGPEHPPGFYGTEDVRRALNLGAAVPGIERLDGWPSGVAVESYGVPGEVDFMPWLLAAALALAVIDTVVALLLRGLLTPPRRRATAAVVAFLLLLPFAPRPASAQDDEFALAAANRLRLAYVETGIPQVDEVSRAGLEGLAQVLRERTSVEAEGAIPVNVETDELAFFPLLYWPVAPEQPDLSQQTVAKLNQFLHSGGSILFDTRDQAYGGGAAFAGPGGQRLRTLTEGLDVPPLAPVPPDHVLTRAFYLMQDFPGRFAGGDVWVETADATVNDGVSSVIIGSNDWASAWAIDEGGRSMFPVVPGGEHQREMAYRFGVNLVMYALTGNYKSDQVHVPAILERLGQ